jgi:hypothetical protein
MEPNDLPIVVLPLELSDESAAILIEFLHNLTDALERHYAAQLMRYTKSRSAATSTPDPPF